MLVPGKLRVGFLFLTFLFIYLFKPQTALAYIDYDPVCNSSSGSVFDESMCQDAADEAAYLNSVGACSTGPAIAVYECTEELGYNKDGTPYIIQWNYCWGCKLVIACANAAFPACGGTCAPGYVCQAAETACTCVASTPSCSTTAPTGLFAAKTNSSVSDYTFYWTNGAASTRHILKICKNSDYTNCLDDIIVSPSPAGQGYNTPPIPLTAGTYYYWRVTNDGAVCDKYTNGTPFLSSCELSVSSLTIPLGQHAIPPLQTMISSEVPSSGSPSVIGGVRYYATSLCYPQCEAYYSSVQCNGYPYCTWYETSTCTGSLPVCTTYTTSTQCNGLYSCVGGTGITCTRITDPSICTRTTGCRWTRPCTWNQSGYCTQKLNQYPPCRYPAVTLNPTNVDSPGPYITDVFAANLNADEYRSTITSKVYATITDPIYGTSDVPICEDTINVNVTGPGPWWQVKDGDVSTNGNLISPVPYLLSNFTLALGISGTGGYPGVPVYGGASNLATPAEFSASGWNANSYATGARAYSASYFINAVPHSIPINLLGSNFTDPSLNYGSFTESSGYYWFKYTGGETFTINGSLNLAEHKVIVIAEGTDVNITGNISLTRGRGFFLVMASADSSGNKGNIYVDGSVASLEGIYIADNVFSTGAGSTQLSVRGTVAANGGVTFSRDLGDVTNLTTPAELFEFAPDQEFLFPQILGYRAISWKEVAPVINSFTE
jgi:hypothetical protein